MNQSFTSKTSYEVVRPAEITVVVTIQCSQVERENDACSDSGEGPIQQATLILLMGWILLYMIVTLKMRRGFLVGKWRSYSGSPFLVVRRDGGPFSPDFWTESFRVDTLKV
jgi:hypothetical protein